MPMRKGKSARLSRQVLSFSSGVCVRQNMGLRELPFVFSWQMIWLDVKKITLLPPGSHRMLAEYAVDAHPHAPHRAALLFNDWIDVAASSL